MVHHRTGWLDPVFVGLSHVGSAGLVWLAIALLLAVLWRRPFLFLTTAAAVLAADLAAYGLKQSTGRERPPLRYPEPKPLVRLPHDGSFPSGHAATSFAAAAILAWAAPRLAIPLFLLAAAIAFSRVYVGVHYPLDVLGGAALGLAIATALRLLARVPPRSRRSPRRG